MGGGLDPVLRAIERPWPWYVAGPLIGLMVPVLLVAGNRLFGVSSSLRNICAAVIPARVAFFRYDWRAGAWNIAFVLGILAGGAIAARLLGGDAPVPLSGATRAALAALGVHDQSGLVPRELFNWHALLTLRGVVLIVIGGYLVGFGTAYAGGCTSGHGITGLAHLELPSLIAVLAFFAGGLLGTWLFLPLILGR